MSKLKYSVQTSFWPIGAVSWVGLITKWLTRRVSCHQLYVFPPLTLVTSFPEIHYQYYPDLLPFRARSSVGRASENLIRRSWVQAPPRSNFHWPVGTPKFPLGLSERGLIVIYDPPPYTSNVIHSQISCGQSWKRGCRVNDKRKKTLVIKITERLTHKWLLD